MQSIIFSLQKAVPHKPVPIETYPFMVRWLILENSTSGGSTETRPHSCGVGLDFISVPPTRIDDSRYNRKPRNRYTKYSELERHMQTLHNCRLPPNLLNPAETTGSHAVRARPPSLPCYPSTQEQLPLAVERETEQSRDRER